MLRAAFRAARSVCQTLFGQVVHGFKVKLFFDVISTSYETFPQSGRWLSQKLCRTVMDVAPKVIVIVLLQGGPGDLRSGKNPPRAYFAGGLYARTCPDAGGPDRWDDTGCDVLANRVFLPPERGLGLHPNPRPTLP